jgi:hypothetical protein
MIVLAIVFGVAALAPGTHGKGLTVPIGAAERFILFLAAVVLLTVAIKAVS